MNERALGAMRPRRADALTRQLGDELIIYDVRWHRAHCLNDGAACVWLACDGRTTVSEIVAGLASLRGWDESIVYVALADLERAGLLEQAGTALGEGAVRARREALRKIGMAATTLTLPLITSLLVPTPARAASCFPLLHACSNNGQCCSGRCGLSGVNLVCIP